MYRNAELELSSTDSSEYRRKKTKVFWEKNSTKILNHLQYILCKRQFLCAPNSNIDKSSLILMKTILCIFSLEIPRWIEPIHQEKSLNVD